jgi:hypothetical protein
MLQSAPAQQAALLAAAQQAQQAAAYFQQQAYAQQQQARAHAQQQAYVQQMRDSSARNPMQDLLERNERKQQRDKLGAEIYPKVVKALADLKDGMVKNGSWPAAVNESDLPGKVTGMLLEMEALEVAKMSSDADELSEWILRACDVLSSAK